MRRPALQIHLSTEKEKTTAHKGENKAGAVAS